MFNTKIPLYGIFILIAIFVGLYVVYKNSKSLKYKKEEIMGLLLYILLGSIYGAKYFTYFANPQKYNGNFEFAKVGLSSYGAVIGILLLLFLFSLQFKKKIKDLVYIILPALPLMYGIGKIGCFLAGCCYGIKYSGPFSIIYNYSYSAPKGVSLFPIQLLEAIVFIGIFIYIHKKTHNKKANSDLIGLTFVLCGLAKFLLEYLRMSHVGHIITLNQSVSLLFVIIGFYFWVKPIIKDKL